MKPRRWFRYSLRTFFVLLTLLGGLLAWAGVQVSWIKERHRYIHPFPRDEYWNYNGKQPLISWLLGEEPVDGIRVLPVANPREPVHQQRRLSRHEFERKIRAVERAFPEAKVIPLREAD